MILPTGAASFSEAMRMGSEVYHHLKDEIKKRYGIQKMRSIIDGLTYSYFGDLPLCIYRRLLWSKMQSISGDYRILTTEIQPCKVKY